MEAPTQKAPGKHYREGISLFELERLFPDNEAAERWFEDARWNGEPCCPRCGGLDRVKRVKSKKPMPWHCGDCRRYFSVRTGTVIEASKIPFRKWAYAIFLWTTSLKGVSSMKLHRDLNISQKAAWFMAHRLREAYTSGGGLFSGPVEVDETYTGGKRKNMPKSKREKLTGRGAAGKMAVAGVKDRKTKKVSAAVVQRTDRETLHGFIRDRVEPGATVYTDDATAYRELSDYTHDAVKHSLGEYVKDIDVHTNGIESLWSMFKRGFVGTYHRMSPKHLHRYVAEFVARQNVREEDTLDQMLDMVRGMIGRRLMYTSLIEPNGLPSGARR
ncbi:MAG: IS1595 family transposase [Acidobacteria bacterium]|nr:IS1595 family transposase [Acidobacteriota bacterium]